MSNDPLAHDVTIRIAAPGGEVIAATAADKERAYDQYHFAPARRAGDTLYVSGVVATRSEGEPSDHATYQEAVRRAFQRIAATLAASGAKFSAVALLNTFHDWAAAPFNGDCMAQFKAFGAVKDEFIQPPYPAWTAVGTSALIVEGSMVEIQVIAHLPSDSVNTGTWVQSP